MNRLILVTICLVPFLAFGCGSDSASSDCTNASTCGVLELVNAERESAGLEPLAWDPALGSAAQLHADDMLANDYFSHTSQDGRRFSDRVQEAGYDGFPRAENIALGQRTAEEVMNSWLNSSGHRTNILNAGSTEIGIGRADGYWVQVFGSP